MTWIGRASPPNPSQRFAHVDQGSTHAESRAHVGAACLRGIVQSHKMHVCAVQASVNSYVLNSIAIRSSGLRARPQHRTMIPCSPCLPSCTVTVQRSRQARSTISATPFSRELMRWCSQHDSSTKPMKSPTFLCGIALYFPRFFILTA